MANTRLSPIEKIGYGLGDFGSNVVFQTVIILLPSFYTDVFGLAPAAMGLMFLLVRLLDTVTDPIMGVIADNTNTRWGKFRPYMLWFSVPFAVVFVLTYWTPDLAGNQKLFYAYVTYAALMLLYTVVNIPYCALGGVITADSQERVSANSYRFFLATSAGVLITWYGPTLITYFGKGNDRIGYPWAMAVFGVLAVFAFIGCFALTKERVVEAQPAKKSFWRDVGTLVKNDQWVVVAFLGLVSLVAIVLRAGSAAFYIKCAVGRPDLTAEFLTAGTFAAMIGAAFAAPLTAKLDKGPSYAMLQIIIVIGSVGIYFAPTQNIFLIFGLYILVNFLTQMAAPILFSMAADTADYGEFKTGRRVTGLIFS
jgi:GPH family glycoside/pentoside/hexuronide:cation symporter